MRDHALSLFEWSAKMPFSPHDAPIKVLEGMIFEPADPDFHPFAWVQDLFDERARLIKIDPNDVTAIVMKLVLNSLYGKLAQYVGTAGRPPSYASPWMAAAITAGTQRMLMSAALTAPKTQSSASRLTGALSIDPERRFARSHWEGGSHSRLVQAH